MPLSSVVSGGLVAAYLALFAIRRRPVALRLHRLGYLLAIIIVFRGAAAAFGRDAATQSEVLVFVLCLGASVVLMSTTRVWIARQDGMTLRDEICRAGRRLLLPVEEQKHGLLMLKAPGRTSRLYWFEGGESILLVVLPRKQGKDKVSLLLDWLDKQYAGPLPRIHINP